METTGTNRQPKFRSIEEHFTSSHTDGRKVSGIHLPIDMSQQQLKLWKRGEKEIARFKSTDDEDVDVCGE